MKNDVPLKKFVETLREMPDSCLKRVIKKYYEKCNHAHATEFFLWRQKMKELKDKDFTDLYEGFYYPYLKLRVVIDLDSIHMYDSNLDQGILAQ